MQDETLKDELEYRIDTLNNQEESIKSDIGNEFLTPEGYLKNCVEYAKKEKANLKQATADGLDAENLEIIKTRLLKCLNEVEDGKKQMAAASAPAEPEPAAAP